MKNEKTENQKIENLLKSRMNELSESVDCFDKISARAFPEKNQDFSESGFIISDLENITGKSKKPKAIKWTVIAAAAVFCIAVIPKTGMVQRVFSNLGNGSAKKIYQDLLSEINTETMNNDYITMDFPLNYYIDNDVLITPLLSCPFENCGNENLNVRIFIRQINGIYTNQVYAVEYAETYSENNIIAAADTESKFTPEDVEKAEQFGKYGFSAYNLSDSAIELMFGTDNDGLFIDNDGEAVSLASFLYPVIIKDENDVTLVTSEVIYGHRTLSDDEYFYDISAGNYSGVQLPDRRSMWSKSVYYNGNTAMPEENISHFTMTEIFGNENITTTAEHTDCIYVRPFYDYKPELNETVGIYAGKQLSKILIPSDTVALTTAKFYFSPYIFSDDTGKSVTIKSNIKGNISNLTYAAIVYDNADSENELITYYQNQEELRMKIEKIKMTEEEAKMNPPE